MPTAHRDRVLRKLIQRFLVFVFVPVLVVMAAIRPGTAATAKHYTDLKFPPLPEVQIPDYSRFQLENGLTVYLMENHELPLVSGIARMWTGERFEPAQKVGLADMAGTVMRTGGTQQHPADQLNQMLEQRAAAVETSIDLTSGNASFGTLSEDLDTVFSLFAEVIRTPAFAEDKLVLAKTQSRGSIARRNDDPDEITGREFKKLIYGADSPYARTKEYQTLDNISSADVVNFYKQNFYPNAMILGIVGDFNTATMTQRIKEKFEDWPASPQKEKVTVPGASQLKAGETFIVDQPQLTQSNVQIGHLGGQFNSPDVFSLLVMNEALNSFGGRLFNEVRSRQGLAYSVYAVWDANYDYPGLFISGGQTRSEATVPFIKAVLSELEKVRTAPLSAAELQQAKDSILNSFVFNFQDPAQTLSRLIRYEYYGYPDDFIFQYQRAVKSMTAAKVQAAANKYLKPNQIVTLVVGNKAAIQPRLETLNTKVTPIDITIPQPTPSAPMKS
ncbi:MAG: insulinase family protein [Acaryochloris sp. RU_4_1]|nr:insulinase family protein [Acaryochloris sp. RU_4_1]NJN37644.1 insulinase family protein [Acaryochloridaceae cyanobacterium CSU_3_4]NJR56205.1 insulinase family protein [Acaryochloris sp. CRU_2_0]